MIKTYIGKKKPCNNNKINLKKLKFTNEKLKAN